MVTQKRSMFNDPARRGAILVWSAVIMTFLLAMTAFAVDISYMTVVATQHSECGGCGRVEFRGGVDQRQRGGDCQRAGRGQQEQGHDRGCRDQ